MSVTSGLMYAMPLARWDRATSCWRTSPDTCLWDLPMSLGTLPAWGMTQGGELFELPMPERRISEPGSSSLPTPVADHSRGLAQPGSDFQSLPNVALSLLPTPAVNDMGAGKDPQAWDEWTERMKEAHGNGNGHGKSLEQEALRMLPTPATMNGKSTRAMTSSTENGRRSGGGQSSPPGLEEVASILSGDWPDHMPPVDQLPPSTLRMLPTPTVQQGRNATSGRQESSQHHDGWTLQDVIYAGLIGASMSPPSDDGSDSPGQHPSQPSQEPTASSDCLPLSSSG